MKKENIALVLIFLAVFSVRMHIASGSEYLTGSNSYNALRQAQSIRTTGRAIFHDELSYGGNEQVMLPFFYYLTAAFTLMGDSLGAKVMTNLFASTSVFAVYMIVLYLTKNRRISLMTSLVSGFVPAYLYETTNSISELSLMLPMSLFTLVIFLNMPKARDQIMTLIVLISLQVLISPSSFILVLGLLIYAVLCYIEKIRITMSELEPILFTVFLYLWANFIVFKKAFWTYGLRAVWQNAPYDILSSFFARVSLADALYMLGFFPLLLGLFTVYNYLFRIKSQSVYLMVSVAMSAFILSWFRLISEISALIYLGIMLVILSATTLKDGLLYLRKTRAAAYENHILSLILLVFILSVVVPGAAYAARSVEEAPDHEQIDAFEWIRENAGSDAVILGDVLEGSAISYFTGRKNAADTNFMMVPSINVRMNETRSIFTTRYMINALEVASRYNISHIYMCRGTMEALNQTSLHYEGGCFPLVYSEGPKIYVVNCSLKNEP